jgi:phospholipid N-methyltransferase
MSINYIKNFFLDKDVGSVTPTSQVCIKRVCGRINFSTAKTLVEFGPGGGCFTRYMLSQMKPDARLIAIEKNGAFVETLKKDPALEDPRFSLVEDSVTNAGKILEEHGAGEVDAIVSGVPFAMFDDELRKKIIFEANNILKKDGKFIIYQFYPPITWKGKKLDDYLAEQMHLADKSVEFPNIPPLRIFEAIRKDLDNNQTEAAA